MRAEVVRAVLELEEHHRDVVLLRWFENMPPRAIARALSVPVETVRSGRGDVRRLAQLVAEMEAVEVVVGLPRSLNGTEGPAAEKARALAGRLARRVAPVPVRLCDERLTTVSAE